ncbi:MAG: hypothetical protein QXO51_04775 [Halobacteria archaeon]
MAEDALKDNLRKLSEIETDIEELTRMEKLFDRLASAEAAIHRLEEGLRGLARTADVQEVRRDVKLLSEGRASLERGLQLLEQRMLDQVGRLAAADAAAVRDLEGFRKYYERLQALETAVDKLGASGFVNEKRFEELRDALDQQAEEIRRRTDARLGAQEAALQKLRDEIDRRTTREETSDLAAEARALQARIDSVERGVRAQAEATQGSVERLSEVDAKIIDDISKVQRSLERLGEVDRLARRAMEAAAEKVTPAKLDEVRSDLLEKMEISERLGERVGALEATLRRLQNEGAAALRREDLEPLRQSVKELQMVNVPAVLERRDAQLQALRTDIERLSRVDGEIIREMGRLAKAYGKVADLEREVARKTGRPLPPEEKTPEEPRRAPEVALPSPPASPPEPPRHDPESKRREKEQALQAAALLQREYAEGAITRASYVEVLRSTLAHLQELRKEAGLSEPDEAETRLRAELQSLTRS